MKCKAMQVIDLFCAESKNKPVKSWVPIHECMPEINNGIFKVKLFDGSEIFAYFFKDQKIESAKEKAIRTIQYSRNPRLSDAVAIVSHWYCCKDGEPITITHWGKT